MFHISYLYFDSTCLLNRETNLPTVWVDADACHVKAEIVHVCKRYGVAPKLISNKIAAGFAGRKDVEMIIVPGKFDAADDYVVEHLQAGDLVMTGDIPLAGRAIRAGAYALDFRGRWFTEQNIGDLLAKRGINIHLRETGVITGGPSSPKRAEKSLLLQQLNNFLDRATRTK
jgi:uncharacterized protein